MPFGQIGLTFSRSRDPSSDACTPAMSIGKDAIAPAQGSYAFNIPDVPNNTATIVASKTNPLTSYERMVLKVVKTILSLNLLLIWPTLLPKFLSETKEFKRSW